MKPLFKLYIPKILFLLLVTNTGIRPAAMVPAVIATEELAVMGVAVIHQVLVQYRQRNKSENEILLVNVPETSVPMQSISVVGKSDEQVVAELTQVVTKVIGIKHNLSTIDQSKLDSQLRSQKLTFINTIAHNRSLEWTQRKFASHRATIDQIKSSARTFQDQLDQKIALSRMKNFIVRLPKNLPVFQKDIQNIQKIFVDCNSPNLVQRIKARIYLSHLVKFDPDLFGDIRKVVCNLQARYFDKDKLVDISYDRRLAETTWMLFRNRPFHWGKKELKKFVGIAKRDNLDLEGGFERLYRRISLQLSAKEKRQNKEYKPIAKLGKGKFFTHDRHKQILNESYNRKLFEVAALCEQGRFEQVLSIANRFRSTIKSLMMNVIDHYHQNPISLAPNSDSPGTEQPISDITPPPLPPDQDPDKDKKQEQDREQAKKKNSRPVSFEERIRIKKSQEEHTWGDRPGHLVKTPKNIKLVEDVANDSECHLGPPDDRGHHWYGKILEDGKQVWAKVRNNEIIGWGVNKPGNIRTYNSKTGLDALKLSSQKILKLSGKKS